MFKIFKNTKVKCAISNVFDGNMSFKFGEEKEVLKNRKNFLEKNNIPVEKCVGINLAHGSEILTVSQNDASLYATKTKEGDALLTNQKGIFLFMMTADCLPIIIFDPVKEVLALVHCGWKSTEEKIIQKVIQKMMDDYKSEARNVIAVIGPGIHKESYRFPNPIQKSLPGWKLFLSNADDGQISVDLPGYNVFQLKQSGILSENIEVSPADTVKDKNYFSHYRSVCTGEAEGRFCTVVGIK